MNTIFKHKSIRKFKNTPIEKEIVDKILLAASKASNTGNMQLYSIIVTKDEGIKNKLWEAHFKQNMVKEAPIHLTFCADINRFNKWCQQSNANPGYDNFLWFYNATIDAVLASQNACLEAENNNLGICYLGTTTYMADKIIDILNLPKGVVPVTSVVIGYPNENPDLTDRLPQKGIIHQEKYSDYTESEIRDIFFEKDNSEFYKKLVSENETENLAQIFTEKRYKLNDNIHFSKAFLETLKKQDYFNQ